MEPDPVADQRDDDLVRGGAGRVQVFRDGDFHFAFALDGGLLRGRGACDAKGILAAQVTAAERLREEGEARVGLLFVVGEERGSDGAAAANTIGRICRNANS